MGKHWYITSLTESGEGKHVINTVTLLEWGLCEEVSDNPLSTSKDFLKKIIVKPLVAQQMVKESINRQFSMNQISILEQDQVLLTRKFKK